MTGHHVFLRFFIMFNLLQITCSKGILQDLELSFVLVENL